MQALYFDGQLKLVDTPRPEPGEGEALVRVILAGICQTDIEITKGYKGFTGILGHEFVGRVAAAAEPAWIGQRVVGEINVGCGHCQRCRQGLAGHCESRRVLGIHGWEGALADYLVLPLANLHPVPERLPDALAVFTEPVAAALEVLQQVHILPDSRVLVVGDGKLGLLLTLCLRLTGCELHLVGRHPAKMDLVGARGVTTHRAETFALTDFDVVVEATGSPAGWQTATAAVRPRGVIVLKSTYHQGMDYNPSDLVVREVTVTGSRCGPFAAALRLLSRRLVNPRKLVAGVFPLSRAMEAMSFAGQRGVLKVLVEMGGDGPGIY